MVFDKGINDMPKNWTKENKREYRLWCHILERCYSRKFQEKNPTYIGCTVCDRWLRLSNFIEDLPKIEGYEMWLNNQDKRIALDKDIKSNGKNKCYCLEECVFTTPKENTRQAWYGRKHTKETKDKMSESKKGKQCGENHPMYGKHHTEESKKKISNSQKGKHSFDDHYRSKKIAQLEKQMNLIKKYNCIRQAEKETEINHRCISDCCRGKQKTAGGYIWMYEENYNLWKQLNEYQKFNEEHIK